MRAIWTGNVSFGLVNIPIRLFSAAESRDGLELHMLHEKDKSPIRYARVCRADGQEVPYDEIVKGYEYRKGDYIVLDDKDFEKASPKKTKTIDIIEFVDEKEIDVRYFERPYYLEPDKGADHPYALLREALEQSGKVAVAKFVLRNREHLAAVKPVGQVLVLNQMRFSSDLRQPGELNLPGKTANKKEIDMALALISQLTEPFIPEDFHDTYTEELEKAITAKAKGKPVTKPGEKVPAPTEVKDLMAALKASLEKQAAS